MSLYISLCLIPVKEQEKQIKNTIDLFAAKYHSYSFIPHLTLYCFGMTSILDDLNRYIDSNLGNTRSFNLQFDGIDFSDVFSKTLFAKYKINNSLTDLYNIFHNQYKSIHDYQLIPHLSLMYKIGMKKADKVKEKTNLKLPSELTIDRLYVITTENGGIKKEKDVLQWKIAHQIKFK